MALQSMISKQTLLDKYIAEKVMAMTEKEFKEIADSTLSKEDFVRAQLAADISLNNGQRHLIGELEYLRLKDLYSKLSVELLPLREKRINERIDSIYR